MSMTTTGSISSLMRPGIRALILGGDPKKYQFKQIFETKKSDLITEYVWEMKGLGLGAAVPEGSAIPTDSMQQVYQYQTTHQMFGLTYPIDYMAMINNQYKDKFPNAAKQLKNSMDQTKEIVGASVLNHATDASQPLGDGMPMLSTAHPLASGGTYSNTLAAGADLNETSLQSIIVQIQMMRDQSGLLTGAQPRKLIVPPQGQWNAERLLKSAYAPSSANNAVNPIVSMGILPEGYEVNQYIDLPESWFVLTDQPGMVHYERVALDTDSWTDKTTRSFYMSAFEVYSFNCENPRAIAGCANV